jgi:hypothetical protein
MLHPLFKASMNKVFQPFVHNFVLVFFDDILIYSKNWEAYVEHVNKAVQLLQDNRLFLKHSKCALRACHVEYLKSYSQWNRDTNGCQEN